MQQLRLPGLHFLPRQNSTLRPPQPVLIRRVAPQLQFRVCPSSQSPMATGSDALASHPPLRLSAVGGLESMEASTDSTEFRARGLKARSELTTVISHSPDHGLAPVFIGGDEVAGDKQKMQEARVSHVVNVTTHLPDRFPDAFDYHRISVLDSRDVNISEWLPAVVEFISQARKTGTGVLVHCLWGVSRAPTVVCAYMVWSGSTLRAAVEAVSAARPAAQPNSAFMQQLIVYEEAIRGSASLTLQEYKAAIKQHSTSSTSVLELISPSSITAVGKSSGPAERIVVLDGHQMLVKRLCSAPRMAMIEDFLTPEEADAAVTAAIESGRMHRSRTAPRDGARPNSQTEPGMPSLESSGRTSSNCRLDRTHPVGAAALRRASHITGLSPQHAEALQVVHYDKTQRYNAHYDYFQEGRPGYEQRMGTQGQRVVTCFVYLNDVEGGGCTFFPELKMRFKPRKGSALLWYNTERDGSLDPKTLHAGEAVQAGEKWGMNIWLRQRPKQVLAKRK
mmetsp:Transcript_40561/g.114879  ORF Transcript_40561/g.114879 Transcript_40561/m.114879 type:complete len:506 (-) Transcript_40561:483-2000(-)